MGRGKGSPTLKINPIKAGSILFEIKGVNNNLAVKALHYCSRRLPVKSTIVKNYDQRTNNFKGSW
jgi:large subunit ribosomal protein L16